MKKLVGILFAVLFAFNCSAKNDITLLEKPPFSDSNSDSFWQTIAVSKTTLSKQALIKHIELCGSTGADSQLVIYKGKIVSEWYSKNYQEPVGAMSSTKVIASILIGKLADDGKIKYETKVNTILPEWTGGYRDKVKIIDLLTHTAGFKRRSSKEDSIGFCTGNKTEFALSLAPDFSPGKKFEYSNEGVQLLEPIINKVSQMKTVEFAQKTLFGPLGMKNTQLYSYGGSPWLYAELRTTPRDLARIGLLMKNNGKWKEQQIISADYVTKATKPIPQSNQMGYLWWILDKRKTVDAYYASGYLNTDIYVFKKYDVVIVRTQAPKNGYLGKKESGNYFKFAMPLFKQIVNEK